MIFSWDCAEDESVARIRGAPLGEGALCAVLEGERPRETCGREVVLLVGETGFRTAMVALLFIFALGRGAGVGEVEVGNVLSGEGGRFLL